MADFLDKLNQKFDTFTASHKAVATYIMDNYDESAFKTLEEMASDIGVSTTTIIRFARLNGLSGYTEMQKAIRNDLRTKVALPDRLDRASAIPEDMIFTKSMENDIDNIRETFAAVNPADVETAVKDIHSARHVYVLGMRGSYALAHYTFSRFAQIKENVRLIDTSGMYYPEDISGAGEGDVCIVFMFPRYSTATSNLVKCLKGLNVRIILFACINHMSIKQYGDIILPCSVRGISYKNSYSGPVALINCLAALYTGSYKEESKEVLTRTESILSQGYYLGLQK